MTKFMREYSLVLTGENMKRLDLIGFQLPFRTRRTLRTTLQQVLLHARTQLW